QKWLLHRLLLVWTLANCHDAARDLPLMTVKNSPTFREPYRAALPQQFTHYALSTAIGRRIVNSAHPPKAARGTSHRPAGLDRLFHADGSRARARHRQHHLHLYPGRPAAGSTPLVHTPPGP